MRTRPFLYASAIVGSLALPLRTWAQPRPAQTLPPLSYVCPMPADAAVLEDKPGKCPKCGMTLEPIRLDSKWWCPVHQVLEVHDGPGKCRRDGRDLVQVTLSEFWRCSSAPDKKFMEPGACADGQTRTVAYELRAHGDHNPRHGGQFFMAEDQWHHLEGTYPQSGVFRAYFYDNFTKPMPVKDFSGTVIVLGPSGQELGSFPLKPGTVFNALEARVPSSMLPFKAAAKVKFGAASKEQRFDFAFAEYSKDTAPTPQTTKRTTPTAAAQSTSRVARTAAPPSMNTATSASAAGSRPSAGSAEPAASKPQSAPATTNTFVDLSQTPPALAAALDESSLPTATPALLTELSHRSKEIEQLVHDGNLGQVWLPAMGTKTVALVLAAQSASLPEPSRAAAVSATKRIVTAAWQLDAYGDLGNRAKIDDAYAQLASAVADLDALYKKGP